MADAVTLDSQTVTSLIEEAAEREIIPRFRQLEATDITTKSGPDDLVTAADLACEAFLTPTLAGLIPGSTVVGEEAVEQDRGLLRALERSGTVWIIDPVDGTYNFAHGAEDFAVCLLYTSPSPRD